MAGYLIANITVTDPEAFGRYRDAVAPVIAQLGGRYLVRGGAVEEVEGSMALDRVVVLEFPSIEVARAFYHSAEYAPLIALRGAATRSSVALVEGYAG
jgi:uncharacterized protein (DUF1330 family)